MKEGEIWECQSFAEFGWRYLLVTLWEFEYIYTFHTGCTLINMA